jgi:hypothetical protein
MSEAVRNAVFGNVGTIISFRVSPDDAPFLQKYFEPQFEAPDLIQQPSRYFITSMMINGEKAPAFSAKTLNLPAAPKDMTAQIIELTRQRYTIERAIVEARIMEATGMSQPALPEPKPTPPAKAKTENQLNKLDKLKAEEETNAKARTEPKQPAHIGKLATSLLKPAQALPHTNEAGEPKPAKKRRRRRRKGKGSVNVVGLEGTVIKPVPEAQPKNEETVIRLR